MTLADAEIYIVLMFEGLFDLVLHLIARQKVDLGKAAEARSPRPDPGRDQRMQELNWKAYDEFLVVAAT